MSNNKKIVFYDRDGVINYLVPKDGEFTSPRTIEELQIYWDVKDVLLELREEGFLNFIVTNQPGIARGYVKEYDVVKMHKYIMENLAIDDIFMCPHDDSDNCPCRKPKIGKILQAASKYNFKFLNSFFVGDTWRDVEAAERANCYSIVIDRPYNQNLKSNYRACDYGQIYSYISKRSKVLNY
jgi:D-glycero-D-manno-heptose 1,7-bisphosphate phosphatase